MKAASDRPSSPHPAVQRDAAVADCEHCMYFDWDEDEQDMVCRMNLDEDEYYSFLTSGSRRCRYFRFYDEYKSVQKQI